LHQTKQTHPQTFRHASPIRDAINFCGNIIAQIAKENFTPELAHNDKSDKDENFGIKRTPSSVNQTPLPLPRKAKPLSKAVSSNLTSNNDLNKQQQQTTTDKNSIKRQILNTDDDFDINTEGKMLQHINKNRPKRDRKKKPTNLTHQLIETVELNEDLVVIEKADEPTVVVTKPLAPPPPVPTTTTTTLPLAQSTIETSKTTVLKSPSGNALVIPKSNAEQPKVSMDVLEKIKLRKTTKTGAESKDAESPITTTVEDSGLPPPGMFKANKFRYSCYAGSSSSNRPQLSSNQVNAIITEDDASNEVKAVKIPPLKPPKPLAPPKPPLTSTVSDSPQAEQAPVPFVRLRPVNKPSTESPSSNGATNENSLNKTEQDKRQSVSVKERIQFLSEESKVSVFFF
jgi:hypothetical protein